MFTFTEFSLFIHGFNSYFFEYILCVSNFTSKNLLKEIFKDMNKELATTNLIQCITQ